MQRFKTVKETPDHLWEGVETIQGVGRLGDHEMNFTANPSMWLIHEAWNRGCDFEAEADGYGSGAGTNGDWSGIRDSSPEARDVMLTKALNYLFA